MHEFLIQCGSTIASNYPLLVSMAIGGLLGSAGHCSIMCSPLVVAQMLSLHESRKPQWLLGFYHAGRISSYVVLGMLAATIGAWVFNQGLGSLSQVMLLIAGGLFFVSAIFPKKTHHCCPSRFSALRRVIDQLPSMKLQHYLRGVLMGFMPCGMLWSALLLASTHGAPKAAMLMLVFGLSTVPMLQLVGTAALSLGRRFPQAGAGVGRAVMAMNGMVLCGIGLNLVHVN